MDIGASETETFWQEIPRKLKYRGLAGVKLVISNAHEGVMAAVSRVFRATWQRAGCTPSEGNPPMGSTAASLPGGRLCSGMTWRVSRLSSWTMMRSMTSYKMACWSAKGALSGRP
jgi:Transposase, Mutator family